MVNSPFGPRNLYSRIGWRQRYECLRLMRTIFGMEVKSPRRNRRYRRGREAVRPRHRGSR